MYKCQLCKREVPILGKHHLIPKQKAKKGTKEDRVINICLPCHKQIHAMFSNGLLKHSYSTLDKLINDEKIQKWIEWVTKKNPIDIRVFGRKTYYKGNKI